MQWDRVVSECVANPVSAGRLPTLLRCRPR